VFSRVFRCKRRAACRCQHETEISVHMLTRGCTGGCIGAHPTISSKEYAPLCHKFFPPVWRKDRSRRSHLALQLLLNGHWQILFNIIKKLYQLFDCQNRLLLNKVPHGKILFLFLSCFFFM